MKHPKKIFKILIVFLFLAQNSFATTKPIIGIGIVVKKNPGGGTIAVPTGNGGGFSTQLEEGEYELSFPQEQLQSVISKLLKRNYPKSIYQYDGSGIELTLDNPQIRIKLKPTRENIYTINEQNNSFIIIVPIGGATLSGILSWNDDVMKNSISCPDGFVMKNGECVPMSKTGNQQERTEGKLKGKIVKGGDNGMISVSAENSETPNNKKGWDGSIKGKNIAEKGISEKGLKRTELETIPNETKRKGIKENGLKKNEMEASQVDSSKAINENPNDNSGEPEQQVYLFSNGCTRTCTGNWYSNTDGSVGCDGTAGPRVCINKTVTTTPSATARVSKKPDMKTQNFDQEGNVKN